MSLEIRLNDLELKYGGLQKNIIRKVKSRFETNNRMLHTGGDRMNSMYHNYSKTYAKFMEDHIDSKLNIAEVGILNGIGLAIWSDIFKNSNIFGFDIDTSIYYNNKNNLINRGAFQFKKPIINRLDQYLDNTEYIKEKLESIESNNIINKFDIVIDDGCHLNIPIIKTFESFLPHLSENFVYFIEDNKDAYLQIKESYPHFNFYFNDGISVITKN